MPKYKTFSVPKIKEVKRINKMKRNTISYKLQFIYGSSL